MDASDYGQLEQIISAVAAEAEAAAENDNANGHNVDTGFQEMLGLQFQTAKRDLVKNLSVALEMVKGRLKSTHELEKELSQLRREKQRLASELASARGSQSSSMSDCFDGCFSPPTLNGCVSPPTGSPSQSTSSSEEQEEEEEPEEDTRRSIKNVRSSILIGSSVTVLNSAKKIGKELFGARTDRPSVVSALESVPVLPNAVMSPPPIEELLGHHHASGSKPKSAMKGPGSRASPGSSRRGSEDSDSSSVPAGNARVSMSTLALPKKPPKNAAGGGGAKRGSRATSQRSSVVSFMVQPGEAPTKPKVEVICEAEELFNSECEEAQDKPLSSRISRGGTGACDLMDLDEYPLLEVWHSKADENTATAGNTDNKTAKAHRKMSLMMFDLSTLGSTELMTLRDDEDEEWNYLYQLMHRLVVPPGSVRRAAWDITSIFLLMYDMVTVPLYGAFEPPPSDFMTAMIWITRFFWTLDIVASFITGFMKTDGVVEMRPIEIWKRYVRTWLMLDVALVFIDWVELFVSLDSSIDFARFGKASRGFRILRLLRLLRMIRFGQLVAMLDERIRSDRLMILADVVKIIMLIILSAHFAACGWYGIGIGTSSSGTTWVSEHIKPNETLATRYAVSLHWSMSQFAGGMDEFVPHNLAERLYAITLFLVAFMMAAVLVSSLTSEITRLQIISNTHAQQMSCLRRFLVDNNVSTKLAVRVQRNAKHSLHEQQRHIPESSVELLQLVSDPLRMELHFECLSPLLSKHPFFNQYIEECPHIMRKVCHKCTKMSPSFAGDVIFNPGETPRPPKMYFVANGSFEYFLMSGHQVAVRMGSWISEPVLWTNWTHKGGLRAKGDSHLCELLGSTFQEVCMEFDHTSFDPRSYGAQFVELLNSFEGNISDLPMPKEQLEEASATGRTSMHRDASAMVRRGSGGMLRFS